MPTKAQVRPCHQYPLTTTTHHLNQEQVWVISASHPPLDIDIYIHNHNPLTTTTSNPLTFISCYSWSLSNLALQLPTAHCVAPTSTTDPSNYSLLHKLLLTFVTDCNQQQLQHPKTNHWTTLTITRYGTWALSQWDQRHGTFWQLTLVWLILAS